MIFKELEYNEMCIDIFPFQLAHDLPSILNTTHWRSSNAFRRSVRSKSNSELVIHLSAVNNARGSLRVDICKMNDYESNFVAFTVEKGLSNIGWIFV